MLQCTAQPPVQREVDRAARVQAVDQFHDGVDHFAVVALVNWSWTSHVRSPVSISYHTWRRTAPACWGDPVTTTSRFCARGEEGSGLIGADWDTTGPAPQLGRAVSCSQPHRAPVVEQHLHRLGKINCRELGRWRRCVVSRGAAGCLRVGGGETVRPRVVGLPRAADRAGPMPARISTDIAVVALR